MTTAVNLANIATGPAFRAFNSGSMQSIANGTDVVIEFQSKDFDTNGCFNNSNATVTLNNVSAPAWAFAPNIAGYYQINCCMTFTTNGTGVRFIKIFKNSALVSTAASPGSSGDWIAVNSSVVVYLNGTSDHIRINAWQSSGGSLAFSAAGWNEFSGTLLRAA